jgi:hypothetical protein
MNAFLVGLHVVLPIFAFVNVGGAELPVLIRLINTLKESLSLFFVQEYLDGSRGVAMKVLPQIRDGGIPMFSNVLPVAHFPGQLLAAKSPANLDSGQGSLRDSQFDL